MEILVKYLGSGKWYKYPGKPAVVLTIFNFSPTKGPAPDQAWAGARADINNLIIPFFEKNPLRFRLGVKLMDYLDWCKVARLINEGSHLTEQWMNLIR